MQSDGDFIHKPPVGYTGPDSFHYQVSTRTPALRASASAPAP